MTCCFTGHRDLSGCNIKKVRSALSDAIEQALSQGVTRFIAGNALGIDTMAAELVLEKKATHPKITLAIAVPYQGHNDTEPCVLSVQRQADTVSIVSNAKSRSRAFVDRDRYIVEQSDMVIVAAFFGKDGTFVRSGGTKRTAEYARELGRKMLYVKLEKYME